MPTTRRLSQPLLLFALIAAALLALEAWIVSTTEFASHPQVLSLAVTADIVVGVPLLFVLLVVRRGRLPLATAAPVFILALLLAGRILPASHHTYLRWAELALPLVELSLLIFLVLRLRSVVAHYRRMRPAHVYPPETLEGSLRAALPAVSPLVATLLATEVSLLSFGLAGWARRPPSAEGPPPRFSYHRQGGYGLILGFIAFLLVLETAVAHLLLARWSPVAAWILTAASIYALIWLLGDFQASRLQPTVVGDRCLHVRVGMRWRADIPWSQIEAARRITAADKKAPDFLNGAVLGEPRLVLLLREPVRVHGLLGRTRLTAHIGISVDQEGAFLHAVRGQLGDPT